jgi:hypothetical protein
MRFVKLIFSQRVFIIYQKQKMFWNSDKDYKYSMGLKCYYRIAGVFPQRVVHNNRIDDIGVDDDDDADDAFCAPVFALEQQRESERLAYMFRRKRRH